VLTKLTSIEGHYYCVYPLRFWHTAKCANGRDVGAFGVGVELGGQLFHQIRILSGAPRAALVNYTVAVSKVVAKNNVMINNILPGMFHTAGIEDNFNAMAEASGTSYDEEVAKFVRQFRIPAGRFGDADDLGAFVAMFCSEFANYMVGQSLAIDGGVTNATF
jgi:3-oxoacyl-[acyl-carrier protein] reductase